MFATSLPESLEGDGESATVRGGDSPRLKKRRLFNGPQATFSSVIGDAPPPIQQMLQPLKVRTLENSFDRIKRVSPKIAAFFSWDWILLQQWRLILHTFCWFCSSLKILSGMMKIDMGFWAPCQQSGMQAMVITYLISSLNLIIQQKNIFRMACIFVSICIMDLWWPLQSDYHAKCNYSSYCIWLYVVVAPDDSQLSSGDNNNTLESMSENWITTCIEENDSTIFHSHNK